MLRGNNFKYKALMAGGACAVLNASSVDTDLMVEPWRYGRQAVFMLRAALLATTALTVKVIGRLRSDHSTKEVIKDSGGVNDWAFAASSLVDGGLIDTKGALGNIDLGRIDAARYDAIGLRLNQTDAHDNPVAVVQFIYDLYQEPGDAVEDLFTLQPSPVIANT